MSLDIKAAAPVSVAPPPGTGGNDSNSSDNNDDTTSTPAGNSDPVNEITDIMKDLDIDVPPPAQPAVIQMVYIYVYTPSCSRCAPDAPACSGDECYSTFVLERHLEDPDSDPTRLRGCTP